MLLCALCLVYGDIYMHNPRGSNDRVMEDSSDRNNAQRLFDSQNNARGGYCWGPELTYYEGSKLAVEWTNQHACGNSNTHCNIVLQYMCTSDDAKADPSLIIRDGTSTTAIQTSSDPTQGANYYNFIDPTNPGVYVYGMNEPLSYYRACTARSRNKGLFVATQNLNDGAGAGATRQNPNADRYGFECQEERDYYPYWHPSPWKDIAVFADHKSQCKWYQSESQNVKAKNYCANTTTTGGGQTPNNAADCIRAGGKWASQPAWGIDKPDCLQAPRNRDNHLGNGVDAHTNQYNWTLPRTGQEDCIKNGNCTCVLRIRYNITVGELTGTEDSLLNGKRSPVQPDPDVTYEGKNYTLAINTAQTGRTFQDRSFMFRIAPRPTGVPHDATIWNLNVRGKRGNIVQTYPATEYDFVPTFLEVTQGDFIHFQWTGCDHNPAGNDGEGRTQTDRSNIVQIKDMSMNYPLNATQLKNTNLLFKDDKLRARMANIDQLNCLDDDDLATAANNGVAEDQNPQNCKILNAAPQRFSGALVKMSTLGSYAYMNTRNNNFSNRSQKAQITVRSSWRPWKTAVVVVAGVAAVGVGAAAGTVFYAKRHPLSKVAEAVHKVPGFSKV